MPAAELPGEVVAEGLNGPMGLLVDPNGDIWVIDSGMGGDEPISVINPETGEAVEAGYGMSTRVVKISAADGTLTDVAMLPSVASEAGASGGNRLQLIDGTLYATNGEWLSTADAGPPADSGLAALFTIGADGTVTPIADFWAFERDENPDGRVLHAHPYSMAAGPDGTILVVNAGGNTLESVDPATGEITSLYVIDPLPGVFPRPEYDNEMLTDAVPTGLVVGEDGTTYIGLLSGAPFVPGNAKVLALSPDGVVSDYATGLTMLTDLRMGPDGNLYATQFGIFGQQGPVPNSGAIVRIGEGDTSAVVASGLPFPTSLDFDADGEAYVTVNGVGAPGSGAVIKLAGLTEVEGTPVTDVLAEVMGAMAPPAEGEAAAEATATPAAEAEATATPAPEAEATATPAPEAEATATPEPAAEGSDSSGDAAGTAPEELPATGGEATAPLAAAAVGLAVAALFAAALVTRRRAA
jgi:sugar lactone lactonase YvrE